MTDRFSKIRTKQTKNEDNPTFSNKCLNAKVQVWFSVTVVSYQSHVFLVLCDVNVVFLQLPVGLNKMIDNLPEDYWIVFHV